MLERAFLECAFLLWRWGSRSLMGATRPASVIVQLLFSGGVCIFSFYFPDAGRVAIRGCVLWLRFVVAVSLLYYKYFTCRVSYILH